MTNLEDTLSVAGQLVMGDTVYEEDGGEIRARPRTLADRTWFQAFETAADEFARGPSAASAAKAVGEKALRLNPSHSYPPFLLYSLMGQMGAGDSEESGAMVSRAIRNHCHHGGGASAALQKRCKDHIMQGNLNLFV
eukprot:COSAG04_NODE_1776_length_5602_cov_25.720880_2_plen_137_part_00